LRVGVVPPVIESYDSILNRLHAPKYAFQYTLEKPDKEAPYQDQNQA
jgi:hypothetical protein